MKKTDMEKAPMSNEDIEKLLKELGNAKSKMQDLKKGKNQLLNMINDMKTYTANLENTKRHYEKRIDEADRTAKERDAYKNTVDLLVLRLAEVLRGT